MWPGGRSQLSLSIPRIILHRRKLPSLPSVPFPRSNQHPMTGLGTRAEAWPGASVQDLSEEQTPLWVQLRPWSMPLPKLASLPGLLAQDPRIRPSKPLHTNLSQNLFPREHELHQHTFWSPILLGSIF